MVKECFARSNKINGISLYIHLPFCERLCTFCGCNKRISINHDVETAYIENLLKEWQLYNELFDEKPIIKEIHLGGGTPTFFSAENLEIMISSILSSSQKADDYEFSLEIHPNVTSKKQLETLYNLGFRRLSIGVQDFDPKVQDIINRKQSYEQIESLTKYAREIGYKSVNFDLVYGLPFQNEDSIIMTINRLKELMPDRIAFYSYAHVPWKSPGQRKFTEDDLPSAESKRKLYELGREMLEETGYVEIGMDHFALKNDKLYLAMQNKSVHRNFMGYTTNYTELLLGLGVSSISDTWDAFMQNEKVIEDYYQALAEKRLPISNGHILTEEDMILRRHILNLMCNFETEWSDENLRSPGLFEGIERLKELEKDNLIEIQEEKIIVTDLGKTFIRNICSCLDQRLWQKQSEKQIFSKSI